MAQAPVLAPVLAIDDLKVRFSTPDGVIEAVEGPGLLGVQWHPERLSASDPRHLAPFAWVVQG